MQNTAFEKITRARAVLILEQPFFGALCLRLRVEEASWVPTLATDGTHLYFNAEYVAGLSSAELKAVLCHAVLHCALGHPWRRGARDPEVWNQAADYVVNGQVISAGLQLPGEALVDPALAEMSTEQAYSALQNRKAPPSQQSQDGESGESPEEEGDEKAQDEPQDEPQDGEDGGGQGEDADDGSESPRGGQNGGSDGDGEGNGEGEGGGEGGSEGQGSGSGSSPDGRPVPSDPTGCGGVMDAPAGDGESGQPTPADYRAQEADWQMAVAQAAQSARSRGLLPGGIESVIEEALQPKAPWQALLREFLTRTARDDYAWTPPNRRHAWNGLYLPSTRSERCGPVVLGIDTSGSVSDEMLAQFEGELNAILEDVKPEVVHVVYCDARVTGTEAYEPDDLPVRLTPRGRGGTAFRPVFDWVEENLDDPPACLVYLTDMYGEPVDDPGYPVLWADYEGGRGPDQPCGERVVID